MPALEILNTAGEPEREARSRRANAVEALGICSIILIALWPFCYGWGVLRDVAWVREAAQWPIAFAAVWIVCISPWWHRDTPESLGLGNPRRLWRMLRESSPARRGALILSMTLVFAGLNYINFTEWPRVARFFHLPASARGWPDAGVLTFGAVLAGFAVTCLIRYDNFGPAFRAALTVSAALALFAGTAAVAQRGWSAFARFEPRQYVLDVIAYVFWGFLQQLVFTSYLGTRLRKAFAPAPQPIPPAPRTRAVALGGALAATTLAPAVWLVVRSVSGAGAAPPALLAWCAAFAFPVGAVCAWYFCRDRRRLLVAALTGGFFGSIHIDSYGLVLVTTVLGIILAWLFMEDRTRNMIALGFIHGFLGSTFGKLFNGDAAGALNVDYHVGPWNVDEPSTSVLIVPAIVTACFVALTVRAWRRTPDDQRFAASCATNSA